MKLAQGVNKYMLYFLALPLLLFAESSYSKWDLGSDGVGFVYSHQGNASKAVAEINISANKTKLISFYVKPRTAESCKPQGLKNGDYGYIVRSKIFVNDTLIHAKKFIEPTSPGKCYIYYVGESMQDKDFLIEAFSNGSDVILEIDGANDGRATKYRGKQVVLTGITTNGGRPSTVQIVKDVNGKEHHFVTVPSSDIRWYRFSTDNFMSVWQEVK